MHTKPTERFMKNLVFIQDINNSKQYSKSYCKKVTDIFRYLSACPKNFCIKFLGPYPNL